MSSEKWERVEELLEELEEEAEDPKVAYDLERSRELYQAAYDEKYFEKGN